MERLRLVPFAAISILLLVAPPPTSWPSAGWSSPASPAPPA